MFTVGFSHRFPHVLVRDIPLELEMYINRRHGNARQHDAVLSVNSPERDYQAGARATRTKMLG